MALSFKGLAKLEKRLKRIPKAVKRRVRASMATAAQRIVSMAKSLVPVDNGDLRDSIGWTWGKAPKGSISLATILSDRMTKNDVITIYAGNSKAFYARWVEFGTAPHVNGGRFKGSEHPGTSAHPFFYVSYRANKKEAKRKIRKALRDGIKASR